MFDLIIITTCINNLHIKNLLNSIILNNKYINTYIYVINQYNDKIVVESDQNNFIKIFNLKIDNYNFLNSSLSRNIAIDFIIKNNIKSHYVCFPDDDTTFDHVFFIEIHRLIQNSIFNNYIFDVYCNNSNSHFHKIKHKDGTIISKNDYTYVGAVNILLKYETFLKTGFFDHRFGVNAIYGAGEDGDYFLRALNVSKFYYTNKFYNFHPPKNNFHLNYSYRKHRSKLINYGKGVIVLLIKHKMYFEALKNSFKALGAFVYYFFKLQPIIAIVYFEVFFVRIFTLILYSFKKI
jgi:hypothetical protein